MHDDVINKQRSKSANMKTPPIGKKIKHKWCNKEDIILVYSSYLECSFMKCIMYINVQYDKGVLTSGLL